MKPLLVVEHGDAADVARAADAFARFYLVQFYQETLAVFVRRRRRYYLLFAAAAALLMIGGLLPVFINSASIFAWLMLVMSAMLGAAIVFCAVKISSAPEYCKQHLPEFFQTEISAAKSAARCARQTRFFAEHLEQLGGTNKQRSYDQIDQVYETEEIFYFKGVGWIDKQRLSETDEQILRDIIRKSFAAKRYVWVDTVV